MKSSLVILIFLTHITLIAAFLKELIGKIANWFFITKHFNVPVFCLAPTGFQQLFLDKFFQAAFKSLRDSLTLHLK